MTFNINFIDMPCNVKSNVIRNEDNTYSIFINSRLNYYQQQSAFKHELKHIEHDDFNQYEVENIEVSNNKRWLVEVTSTMINYYIFLPCTSNICSLRGLKHGNISVP